MADTKAPATRPQTAAAESSWYAAKFRSRDATFGLQEDANLDDGTIWPTSWTIREPTPDAEAEIERLVRRAIS